MHATSSYIVGVLRAKPEAPSFVKIRSTPGSQAAPDPLFSIPLFSSSIGSPIESSINVSSSSISKEPVGVRPPQAPPSVFRWSTGKSYRSNRQQKVSIPPSRERRSGDFDEGLCSAPGRCDASLARRERHETSTAATGPKFERRRSGRCRAPERRSWGVSGARHLPLRRRLKFDLVAALDVSWRSRRAAPLASHRPGALQSP